MQQIEVDVIQSEQLQRLVESAERVVVFVVLHPKFGGNEQVLPFQSAMADSKANLLLIEVGRCGVYHPIARLQRVTDDAFRFVRRYLEHADPDGRHHDAVVQSCFFHISYPYHLVGQK